MPDATEKPATSPLIQSLGSARYRALADALQCAWNDPIMDAGIVPACFEIHGNATVSAEFDEFSPFVRAVMQHLIHNIESGEFDKPNVEVDHE